MSWIKLEISTPDKPEIWRMSRILSIDRDAVLGKLIRVWAWFDLNSRNGSVTLLSQDIDALVTLEGFANAMKTVGWLADSPDNEGLILPNFSRHNGQTAKTRALSAQRQEGWRRRSRNDAVDVPVTVQALPEKRREEKRKERTPPTPSTRKPNEAVEPYDSEFRAAYASGYQGSPYSAGSGDYVQLAKLRKTWEPERLREAWPRALKNYFTSPMGTHTLADLCVRFARFQMSALDKYGKPVVANQRDGANVTAQGNPKITAPG